MSANAEANSFAVDPNNQSILHFEGEGPVHRSALCQNGKLMRDHHGIVTVHELAAYVPFLLPLQLGVSVESDLR